MLSSNIIIIEDEPSILDLYIELIHKVMGIKKPRVFVNAEEALVHFKPNKYDLVIADGKLAGEMTGDVMYVAMKDIDRNIRGIMITGTQHVLDNHLLELFDAVYDKPIDIKEFINCVTTLLNKRSLARTCYDETPKDDHDV